MGCYKWNFLIGWSACQLIVALITRHRFQWIKKSKLEYSCYSLNFKLNIKIVLNDEVEKRQWVFEVWLEFKLNKTALLVVCFIGGWRAREGDASTGVFFSFWPSRAGWQLVFRVCTLQNQPAEFSCQPPSKARARRDRSHVFPVRGDLESARSNEGGVRVKCERQHPAPCS